jgi:hypothetical protein
MASALDEFRAQREAVEGVHSRLTEVADLLRAIRTEAVAVAHDESLRNLLRDEQTWLVRAQDLVRETRHFRERETNRFWPAVWRRWVIAVVLTLATGVAAGAGYVWAGRPYEADLETLRYHADLGAFVVQRVIHMTPAERRQLDGLMKWNETAKK